MAFFEIVVDVIPRFFLKILTAARLGLSDFLRGKLVERLKQEDEIDDSERPQLLD